MIGNVWEWTDSGDGAGVPEGTVWVYGGSYQHRCVKHELPRTPIDKRNSYPYLGFRCAWQRPDAV